MVQGRIAGGAILIASAVALASTPAFATSAFRGHSAAPNWITWNGKSHTANLKLVAAYTGAVNGFNFNGYGKGKMVVTVPKGAKVAVTFTDDSAIPHSAMIVAYKDRSGSGPFTPVFKGASSSNPVSGITKGKTDHFSFTADKAGTYALVCAVPGHASAGMWDVFKVVSGGKAGISVGK